MNTTTNTRSPRLGHWFSIGIVSGAVVLGLVVLFRQNHHPRSADMSAATLPLPVAPMPPPTRIRALVTDLVVLFSSLPTTRSKPRNRLNAHMRRKTRAASLLIGAYDHGFGGRPQDLGNKKKIGQQRAEMAGGVQVID